ncbi:hypothetical protein MKW92_024174 [Papaver armeniacum]|nr:hypothetical protein MKW92_024174 [Papaver armeniacum]
MWRGMKFFSSRFPPHFLFSPAFSPSIFFFSFAAHFFPNLDLVIKILKEMELPKLSSSALKLLIGIGYSYFPVHIDLDLLKLNVRTKYSDDIISDAEDLLSNSDLDEASNDEIKQVKISKLQKTVESLNS